MKFERITRSSSANGICWSFSVARLDSLLRQLCSPDQFGQGTKQSGFGVWREPFHEASFANPIRSLTN